MSALEILDAITDDNAKREFYPKSSPSPAAKGFSTVALETANNSEVLGVNTQAKLAQAKTIMQQRLRQAALDAGVTMGAPETVFLSADTKLARDVTIEPFVVFGPGVTVEEGVRTDPLVLPFRAGGDPARRDRRPVFAAEAGRRYGRDAYLGNFVEVKAATVETGAKINHLTYIGNVRVGERANVGAGTITYNYVGVGKYHTHIGKGAFIGSNSSLVAPVKIGDGAYVGSGSVYHRVPADGLAVGRGRQAVKEGLGKALARKGQSCQEIAQDSTD